MFGYGYDEIGCNIILIRVYQHISPNKGSSASSFFLLYHTSVPKVCSVYHSYNMAGFEVVHQGSLGQARTPSPLM